MRSFGSLALAAYRLGVRLRDKVFSVAVGGAFAEFGKRSVIQLPTRIAGERRIAIGSDVFVGAGAWLGENVVVGPGVQVGRGAVVGENSVELADVPPFGVAVGAPARVVKVVGEPGEPAPA